MAKTLIAVVLLLNLVFVLAGSSKEPPTLNPVEAKKHCDKGDLSACYRLGVLLEKQGKQEESAKVLEPVCRSGDEMSCVKIGYLRLEVSKIAEATKWFQVGCHSPNATGRACFELGRVADKTKSSSQSSKHWFKKACDKGFQQACLEMKK